MKNPRHSFNVLESGPGQRRVWQFQPVNGGVELVAEFDGNPNEPLPSRVVSRRWRALWQKKINVAWLPADQVFLRVLQLPASEPAELQSMVELQLEKLSPLPVAQVVWSMEILPHAPESQHKLQSVAVLIAARDQVEQFLGGLESQNYLADRLELPQLHPLVEASNQAGGLWIYFNRSESPPLALVAWQSGGAVQQLQNLRVKDPDRFGPSLAAELNQMAWAGEIEGWFQAPVKIRLVCDSATAAAWRPALENWSGQPADHQEPPERKRLAELSAARAARRQSQANLLPPGYAERYRQKVIDRLWMRGLAGVLAVYLVGVLAYFGAVQWANFRAGKLADQVAGLASAYTNALQLKAKGQLLQDQLNLKYAALDCLRAVSENLLDGLTLVAFNFSRDKLIVRGVAAQEDFSKITDYMERLQRASANGKPLFTRAEGPNTQARYGGGPNGGKVDWTITCYLNLPKIE